MPVAYQPGLGTEHSEYVQRLFSEHHVRVLRAAYRITGSLADAEDVTQAVFVRLLQGRVEQVNNPGSYLYRAAINGALDLARRRQSDDLPLEAASELPSARHIGHPDQATAVAELRTWLRRALTCLSQRAAEMFVLRYLEGYSNREIAQLMHTSQAVVAVVLHQSRSRLKKQLLAFQRGKP